MKLSIITINYNNRAGLQRTIDSVICQTWKDYEWIVIDGGSTDGSKELIEQYQEYFSYWCSEPDKGVYNAMNKGVVHAHGEYVNFMNSGDAFHNENVLQDVFERDLHGDILFGQVQCIGENRIANMGISDKVDLPRVEVGFCHQGAFTKIELLKSHPFDESLRIVSDWKFWLQTIVFENRRVQDLTLMVADYDMTGISSNKLFYELHKAEREMVMKSFFPPLVLNELADYRTLKNERFVVCMYYLKQNNFLVYRVARKIIIILHSICAYLHKLLDR